LVKILIFSYQSIKSQFSTPSNVLREQVAKYHDDQIKPRKVGLVRRKQGIVLYAILLNTKFRARHRVYATNQNREITGRQQQQCVTFTQNIKRTTCQCNKRWTTNNQKWTSTLHTNLFFRSVTKFFLFF